MNVLTSYIFCKWFLESHIDISLMLLRNYGMLLYGHIPVKTGYKLHEIGIFGPGEKVSGVWLRN